MDFFYQVSYFGPIILFFTVIALMLYFYGFTLGNCLVFYIIFYFFTMVLNKALKLFFKQPRPIGGIAINKLDRLGLDRYGMPSGHANTAVFTLIFAILYFKNIYISIFFMVIALMTMIQRLVYKKHSFQQVCWGALIGATMGQLCYNICN